MPTSSHPPGSPLKRPRERQPKRRLTRRHVLWFGLVAVLLPLAALLAFQYRWLVELETTSGIARRATLENYVDFVGEKSAHAYRKLGDSALYMSASVFTEGRLTTKGVKYLKEHTWKAEGVQSFFVVSLVEPEEASDEAEAGPPAGTVLFYDRCENRLAPRPWSPEVRAIYIAMAPWERLVHKGGTAPQEVVVDERDPQHRLLLNPVTDEESRVVGVVGAVLDPTWLAETKIPQLIQKARWFQQEEAANGNGGLETNDDVVVWLRDDQGRLLYATDEDVPPPRERGGDEAAEESMERVEQALPFAFTDWTLGIASRQATAGQWAKQNFRLNVALSAILALVLLGGVALALRSASKAMRLSQMKSDFVSNVSHELRTPLASVRVFGELLRLGKVGDQKKVREYGEYIETESRRLTQLINNLLDFSSIESGRKSYRFEATDLEELVTETLKTFRVRLRQQGFRVAFQGPDEPLPSVVVDAGALAQSLSNLLDNAVKYSSVEGAGDSREIAVRLHRRGDRALISVQDWGIGIPRDEQDKIFERFHRVSTGLVHDVKGSGLGLAIVHHVLAAHGGKITVESRAGQGSTFTLHVPLEPETLGQRVARTVDQPLDEPEGEPA